MILTYLKQRLSRIKDTDLLKIKEMINTEIERRTFNDTNNNMKGA